jgi:hypothetical protein
LAFLSSRVCRRDKCLREQVHYLGLDKFYKLSYQILKVSTGLESEGQEKRELTFSLKKHNGWRGIEWSGAHESQG